MTCASRNMCSTPSRMAEGAGFGLDGALAGAKDEADLPARARAYATVVLEGLLQRKSRFDGLGAFENAHIRIEKDDFTIDGFDVAPGARQSPSSCSSASLKRWSATTSPSIRR